jgi:hypothetical protein
VKTPSECTKIPSGALSTSRRKSSSLLASNSSDCFRALTSLPIPTKGDHLILILHRVDPEFLCIERAIFAAISDFAAPVRRDRIVFHRP